MIIAETIVRVRYSETDKMGVTHHASYIPYLEEARIHLLDSLGMPYRDLEARGYLLPVLELQMNYKRPCTFDDRVTVKAIIKDAPTARFSIHYEISLDGKILSTGMTRHAFMNNEGRGIKPPQEFLDTINAALSDVAD